MRARVMVILMLFYLKPLFNFCLFGSIPSSLPILWEEIYTMVIPINVLPWGISDEEVFILMLGNMLNIANKKLC